MDIYTKTGDGGETSLFDGSRVPKDHPRIEAYGTVDELNSTVGRCIQALEAEELDELAESTRPIQHKLHVVCAELANPGDDSPSIQKKDVENLENLCDQLTETLPELNHFILPGGSRPGSLLHHGRTVCRRAERRCVALDREESVPGPVLSYLNRLSDCLFMLARAANDRLGVDEAAPDY